MSKHLNWKWNFRAGTVRASPMQRMSGVRVVRARECDKRISGAFVSRSIRQRRGSGSIRSTRESGVNAVWVVLLYERRESRCEEGANRWKKQEIKTGGELR